MIRPSLVCCLGLLMALSSLLLISTSSVDAFSVSSFSNKPATTTAATLYNGAPAVSPATNLPNQFYTWKEGLHIRYQCAGPANGAPVLLVHGLFVNADHWRKSLLALGQAGYRAYAVDLLGSGYSDKPDRDSAVAHKIDGEVWRFDLSGRPAVRRNVTLGTAQGGVRQHKDVELRHPLGSCYNFYTWSDILTSFSQDVILKEIENKNQKVTLVANSIGTISSLQAVLDTPELYTGVFSIAPNFRELHSAEVPLSFLTMPMVRTVQKTLRDYGQGVYDALTKPAIIAEILREPYARTDQVDDTLVKVLLDPLLIPGSSKVVFDTLSYSAGPLPEQQLEEFPADKPVWVCYGHDDPWTPGARVEALVQKPCVERVESFDGVGHCPHDEAPELVHPLLLEFLKRVVGNGKGGQSAQTSSSSS